ncbi:hypothetical protein Pla110_15840 [Polystyrenella longa]|uniref:Uncharacterized protein n=1 Tax=Polystyrenella longa TaxID=2528007 RepID=A0A518CKV7_9PLAN|nr:permease prefix domain 1-containing protein [Polystyrenella longa]QDU79865.1 hypothetical protein Pla110_15840 [Polystyrenella longa]
MPEHEFELYLSLLSRFLKLNSQQREEIAEELRGHLEMRLEDLAKEGHSREEAIRIALDEMGDAGELAQHFSTISKSRRRKMIMRCTLGTAAVLACGLVLFTAFWNEPDRPRPMANLVAEDEGGGTLPESGKTKPMDSSVQKRPAEVWELAEKVRVYKSEELEPWDEQLESQYELDLQGLSLQDAFDQISDQGGFLIVVHNSVTASLGDLISIEIEKNYTNLKLRQILYLLLAPLELTYAPKDGVLYILTQDETQDNSDFLQVRMYDCRDYLLVTVPDPQNNPEKLAEKMHHLMNLVMQFEGEWKTAGEGLGTIQSMNGVLVIKQTADAHAAIEQLLNQLRKPYLDVAHNNSAASQIDFGPERLFKLEQKGQSSIEKTPELGSLF